MNVISLAIFTAWFDLQIARLALTAYFAIMLLVQLYYAFKWMNGEAVLKEYERMKSVFAAGSGNDLDEENGQTKL